MEDTQNKFLENEENELMKEIIERKEKTKEKQQKIIDSLNQIGQMLFFDFYNPMRIFEPDYYITFELVKSCHQILLEYLIDKPYSIEYLCLMIFDILFFDLDDFNYENLDDKIESFEIALCAIKTRNFDQKAKDLLKAYLAKNNIFKELFFLFTNNFKQGLIGFLCLNVLYYCHDITKFVHFFINCLHNTFEVKEDFSNDDIKNLTIEKFILEFIEIIKKEKNIKTISLSIIDSKISYKINTPGTGKHNNNGSNKESTDDTSNNNLTKNIIEISEKISNLEEQEKEEENTIEQEKVEKNTIEQEKESEDSSAINNTTKKKRKNKKNKKNKKIQKTKNDEIKEEEQKQEKKKEIKEEQKEEKAIDNPILNKISFVNVENEKLDSKNEDMAKAIKTLTENMNLLKSSLENEKQSQTEKITNLENQLDQTKSELEETKNKLQKNTQELNKAKQKLKSYSLEITEAKNVLKSNSIEMKGLNLKVSSNLKTINSLRNELIRIKDDLKLVQSREGFKALIDYFYHGLNFGQSTSYKNKIILICTKLKQSKMKNEVVKYQIINFLKEILERLISGNLTAHKFDLNKSVIDQIFCFVNKNYFREIFNIIKTSNADIIIKELITKRDEFFYDKNKLEENEAKIYEKIPELESTLFN